MSPSRDRRGRPLAEVLGALEGLPLDTTLHETTSGVAALLTGTKPGPTILLRDGTPEARSIEQGPKSSGVFARFAALPMPSVAAIGGMVGPATIYHAMNAGTAGATCRGCRHGARCW